MSRTYHNNKTKHKRKARRRRNEMCLREYLTQLVLFDVTDEGLLQARASSGVCNCALHMPTNAETGQVPCEDQGLPWACPRR